MVRLLMTRISGASRNGSTSPSPPVHTTRPRSPIYHCYPPNRVVPSGPTGTHRSPHAFPQEPSGTVVLARVKVHSTLSSECILRRILTRRWSSEY
jgi:hypothetical protein